MPAANAASMSRRTMVTALASALVAGCSKAAFLAVNVPATFGNYRRQSDIVYGSDPLQRLDVYVPTARSAATRPVVLFWPGGRWEFGDKSDYRFVAAALCAQGYVAVVANYRHYPQVKLPGFMEDAARAAIWAAAHASDYHGDPRRLFLMGHSAGAHLAALVTLDPRYFLAIDGHAPPIAGVIGLSGPYDFLPLDDGDLQDMFGPPPLYPLSQPINFVRADAPPMLLVHGLKDKTVRPKNTINLAAALRNAGAQVTLELYPNLTHADTVAALSIPARRRAPTLAQVAAFIDKVGG